MNLPLTFPNKRFLPLAIAVVVMATASAAKAQVLLTINDTNPADVVITATANALAAGQSASGYLGDGVDLINFFGGNSSFGDGITNNASSTGLTSTNNVGTGNIFDSGYADSLDNSSSEFGDLLLYSNNQPTATEVFNSTQAAFTGTMTFDLSGQSLPADGVSGAIYIGWSGSGGSYGYGTVPQEIGTWQVINAPEPSSWALSVISVIGLATFRGLQALRRLARLRF